MEGESTFMARITVDTDAEGGCGPICGQDGPGVAPKHIGVSTYVVSHRSEAFWSQNVPRHKVIQMYCLPVHSGHTSERQRGK